MDGQRGEFNLVGLLVASTLFLLAMGATLSTFNLSERFLRNGGERAEAQARVRSAVDRMARELRNVEAPSAASPQVLDVAGRNDVVFRVADSRNPNGGANTANTVRVRWCLDTTGKLWRATQTWTTATIPAVPATTSCPGSWSGATVVAQDVVNAARGVDLLAYDQTDPKLIKSVRVSLAIDGDVRGGAAATTLGTGVFLRNQDRPPTAAFSVTVNGQGVLTLNGSASADPENTPMSFTWKDGTTVLSCKSIVCTYDPPGATATRTITLVVTDYTGLASASASRQVTA